jgi:hypothetical protein
MYDLLLNTIIPVLAVFWMVVGGIGLSFVLVSQIRPPAELEGTDELANPKEVAKTDLLNGGMAFFFLVAGSWLHWSDDQHLKVPFLVLVSALGAAIATAVLWRSSRR